MKYFVKRGDHRFPADEEFNATGPCANALGPFRCKATWESREERCGALPPPGVEHDVLRGEMTLTEKAAPKK